MMHDSHKRSSLMRFTRMQKARKCNTFEISRTSGRPNFPENLSLRTSRDGISSSNSRASSSDMEPLLLNHRACMTRLDVRMQNVRQSFMLLLVSRNQGAQSVMKNWKTLGWFFNLWTLIAFTAAHSCALQGVPFQRDKSEERQKRADPLSLTITRLGSRDMCG